MSERVQVLVRFRPESEREKAKGGVGCVEIPTYQDTECEIDCGRQGYGKKQFTFDKVFGFDSCQEDLFKHIGKPLVQDVIKGYNGTILAYGQTSSGKTHTMMGPEGGTVDVVTPGTSQYEERGLIPRIGVALFEDLSNLPAAEVSWSVTMSAFELYKEQIRDLVPGAPPGLDYRIREDSVSGKGVYVENLMEVVIENPAALLETIAKVTANRQVASTDANATSSRSHSLIILTVTQINFVHGGTKTSGRLNLVDLAGSEKVAKTGAEGERLKEAQAINLSLTLLGQVIYKLTDGQSMHIPYRDSKLTRILQDSFGGNSRTSLLCACSPSSFNQAETLSTLNFASRAKQIKNKPRQNKEMNFNDLNMAYRKALEEIRVLKDKIADLEEEMPGRASAPVGSGIKAVSQLAANRKASEVGNEDADKLKIAELEAIIRSLREEIQELKQEVLDKTAIITDLQQQVAFYKGKYEDWEAKYNDMKDKYLREKKACDSWMRKATEPKEKEKAKSELSKAKPAAISSLATAKTAARRPSIKRAASAKNRPKKKAEDKPTTSTTPPPAPTSPLNPTPPPEVNAALVGTATSTVGEDKNAALLATLQEEFDSLQESYDALQARERESRESLDDATATIATVTQQLTDVHGKMKDWDLQRIQLEDEIDVKNSVIDTLAKELDMQKRITESRDHDLKMKDFDLEQVQKELDKLKEQVRTSALSMEEKERMLGEKISATEQQYNILKMENSHLLNLAQQLGKEANQRELCDVISIDCMVKAEDLMALENDVYLLEMFEGGEDLQHMTKEVTRGTLSELSAYLEVVVGILQKEPFSNANHESQRLMLILSVQELLGRAQGLQDRVASVASPTRSRN